MRDKFDRDPNMPNPYKEVEDCMFLFFSLLCRTISYPLLDLTIAKVQKELLKEAKQASNANPLSGGDVPSSDVSPGLFFQKAVEVEDRL